MYDELNEELKQMDEIEKKTNQKVEEALSLNDPIKSMPKQKFLVINEKQVLNERKVYFVLCLSYRGI